MVIELVHISNKKFDLLIEFSNNLSDDWKCQIDECLQRLLVDPDRDVRASVGGVYQARGISLSSENLNDDSDSSIQNNTITLDEQFINQS